MERASGNPLLPRGLAVVIGLAVALVVAFLASAPWRLFGREIGRLSPCLGAVAALLLATAVRPSWRRAWGRVWREGIPAPAARTVVIFSFAAAAGLFRILLSRYRALDLSAWDTTLYFDHPIHDTLSRGLLFCRTTGTSLLGTHPSWILLAFVPLDAVVASPLWLLAAQAAALSAGAAAGFLVFRRILEDDLAAGLLAAAFLANAFTARTLQYGFHPEAFYPLAIFLCWRGLLDRRPALVASGAVLALSVKEDAPLLLLAVAASAAIFLRNRRAAAMLAAGAALAFVLDTRIVMPSFAGTAPGRPWYAYYWGSWGNELGDVAVAMARQPVRLARAALSSGAPRVLRTVAFLSIGGPEAIVTALPPFVLYAAADYRPLREFLLYYAMPVLPFVFLGAAYGIRRFWPALRARRPAALGVLVISALDGPGYRLRAPHPALPEIPSALARAGRGPLRIQGSVYPHAGYDDSRSVLDLERPLAPAESVLLCPGTDPFPYSAAAFAALARDLAADPRYVRSQTPRGLVLYVPRDAP